MGRPQGGNRAHPIDRAIEIVAATGLPSVAGAAGGENPEAKPAPADARNQRVPKPSRTGSHDDPKQADHLVVLVGLGCRVVPRSDARRRQTVGGVVSQVGFDQKLGVQLPLDLRFRDDPGRELRLGELSAAARDPGAGLFSLPAALQPALERTDPQPEACVARRGQRF